jgi:hypothetical protein
MNAIPVITPATVTDVFQPVTTELLSMKKKAVAANMPIEINQKEIPTKSSEANNTVSAFAAPEKPTRTKAARANNLILFIKNSLSVVSLDLNLNYGTKPY